MLAETMLGKLESLYKGDNGTVTIGGYGELTMRFIKEILIDGVFK